MSDARGTGRRGLTAFAVATLLLGGVASAHAALTTPACLARKLKEWGKRKGQATENGRALQGKAADPGKCQTKLDEKLAKLTAQATKAAIACRYGVNGDGTATDYDTGLQWEQKTDDDSVHDQDNRYSWNTAFGGPTADGTPNGTAFMVFLGTLNNGTASPGAETSRCFAGHCDWRLPAIEELRGIRDPGAPGCDSGSPCIDETVFGPTVADFYWSATTISGDPSSAWWVFFKPTAAAGGNKGFEIRSGRAIGLVIESSSL